MKQRLVIFLMLLVLFIAVEGYRQRRSRRNRGRRGRRVSPYYRRNRSHTRNRRLRAKKPHRKAVTKHLNSKRSKLPKRKQRKQKRTSQHKKRHLATKKDRRKLVSHIHPKSSKKSHRRLDYASLPGQRFHNPFQRPMDKVDSHEQQILDYYNGPKFGGQILLQADLFLRDANYTRFVRDYYRRGLLKPIDKDFARIDENYFQGSTHYIGDRYVPDEFAIQEMNFEQYRHHLLVTMTADREDQMYINQYFNEQNAQNRMLNFRDTRDIIFESVLRMEDTIYREQKSIVDSLSAKAQDFEKQETEKVFKMMQDTYGKPFYLSLKDKNDIFA